MISIGNDSASSGQSPSPTFAGKVRLESLSDFPTTFESDIVYEVGGQIDLGTSSIIVPVDGLTIVGDSVNVSKLYSSEPTNKIFIADVGGSGNLFVSNVTLTTSGQVFDLKAATGFESLEVVTVNYEDCASLGEVEGYRQGFEDTIGRYGGKPELTLSGNWMGGYKSISTNSLNLDTDFTGSVFKAGTNFVMNNRFYTDANVNLPTNASFADFTTSNFPEASLVQIREARFSRNGVSSSGDNNFFPNLNPDDLVCSWYGNVGLRNTTEGGHIELTSEAGNTISTAGDYYDIAGTFSTQSLDHFDSPSNGQLRNLSNTPQEFMMFGNLIIDGGANDIISVRVMKWSEIDQAFSQIVSVNTQVLSIIGGRDVAITSLAYPVNLEQNDFIKLQVGNVSDTTNITVELGSYLQIIARK